MRFLALFLMAWIASWLTVPLSGDGPRLDLSVGLPAGFLGLFYAFLAWLYARRGEGHQKWIVATGWMLIGIALLGWGTAYGEARDAGLSTGDANLDAVSGWPGIIGLMGVGIIIYAKRLKARHER